MRIVIQCAAKKNPSAGSLRSSDEREVLFVAQPELAPSEGIQHYARPDDVSDDGRTWRERLVAYNAVANNPLHLLDYTKPLVLTLRFTASTGSPLQVAGISTTPLVAVAATMLSSMHWKPVPWVWSPVNTIALSWVRSTT